MKILRLIRGDQLNSWHSWFSKVDDSVTYVMMEVRSETDYVKHHIQKIIGIFAAMRHFANALKSKGHKVIYFSLDDNANKQSLAENIHHLIAKHGFQRFEYMLPDEYRVDEHLKALCKEMDIESRAWDSEHFLTHRQEVAEFFGNKQYLMERFYRMMRQKHGLLMDGNKPVGGRWNYDKQNRKKLPQGVKVPAPLEFHHNHRELFKMIKDSGVSYFGSAKAGDFPWPVNRDESLQLLGYFVKYLLSDFGTYQDAMHTDEAFVFHSRLSFALNTKMLHPYEVMDAAVNAWKNKKANLAQTEGFVRQILGWREYLRGIYWAKMPEYEQLNFFEHELPLPEYFWTGKTKMNCVQHAVKQSLEHAYAHHIQRLMVTGNFALLAGINPDELDKWYLGIYIDAFQWVEITNTRGMSQYADGGLLASKPYVSSANYIDKMSNYCQTCYYNKKHKTEDKACPFNALYWDFIDRNREKLSGNQRMSMMYRLWDKKAPQQKEAILLKASEIKNKLEGL